jgi:hypothetical protein
MSNYLHMIQGRADVVACTKLLAAIASINPDPLQE